VEVRGIMEVSSKKSDGIELIKNIFSAMEMSKGGANVAVNYIGAPHYRIIVTAENFKVAERMMNNTIDKIRSSVEKYHGTFNFVREESKKSY